MTYRLLTDAEKEKLKEVWPQYADTDLSGVSIAGAIDENGMVRAMVVENWVPHCEPMWIEPKAPVDFRRLVRVIEEHVQHPELWVFAPDKRIARIAQICGAKDTHYRVMRKELAH